MAALQYCTFYLDRLLFGVELQGVQEVIRSLEMTKVPLAPTVVWPYQPAWPNRHGGRFATPAGTGGSSAGRTAHECRGPFRRWRSEFPGG